MIIYLSLFAGLLFQTNVEQDVDQEFASSQYIDCVKSRTNELSASELSDEEIADGAVSKCACLVTAVAEENLKEEPTLVAMYRQMGLSEKQMIAKQEDNSRKAARGMALFILENSSREGKAE